MTRNKKAMEMALSTVIIVVMLVIVLIIVGSYFLGGMTGTGEDVENISSGMTDRLGDIPSSMDSILNKFNLPKKAETPG